MADDRSGGRTVDRRRFLRAAGLVAAGGAATAAATTAATAVVVPRAAQKTAEPAWPGAATVRGAVPDGTDLVVSGTGDEAIRAALDAVPDGGVVRLPSGSTHTVTSIALPDKDVILAMQGATVQTTDPRSAAFVQRNRRRVALLGGSFVGAGSGLSVDLSPDEDQGYSVAASGTSFVLPSSQTGIRLTGAREATISECYFETCTGIALRETVNTHVMGCQFKNCAVGVFGDGSATGSAYDAGLMIQNATALGCGVGVKAVGWDWVSIVNSMIDYCDSPVQFTNVDGATIGTTYLSNRTSAGAVPVAVVQVVTDPAVPGGPSQHIKVADSQVITRADDSPGNSVGIRLHGAQWFTLTNTTVHFWRDAGVLVTGPSPSAQFRGNEFIPADGAAQPAAIIGIDDGDPSWIVADNVTSAPLRGVAAATVRGNG